MKVLVYGGKGWIGQQAVEILQKEGHEVIIGNSRVHKKDELEAELVKVKPTHVFSFIGRTHGEINGKKFTTIDYLEQPGKVYENVRDNLFSPMVLGMLSLKHKFHLTYMGTGCIFEYDAAHPFASEAAGHGFTESSVPNFFGSAYSVVKGFTDELMHFLEDTVLNVRIRMPITADFGGRNFITKITHYERICSVPNSMTVLPELLPVMIKMAEAKQTGTINLVNPGLVSHNEILEMYKEIVDPKFTWKNFTVEEQAKILAAGRSNNFCDTTKLESLHKVKNIKDSVREILVQMAKAKQTVTPQ